jgi:RimJ/RimL family protein N-acetyltransferase
VTPPSELRTPRLLLRLWRDDDLDALAEMNADPEIVEFLPSTLTRAESAAMLARLRAHFDEHGFGLWAIEAAGDVVGFTGLSVPPFTAHFTPCVEVGWRLARGVWGRGYATEAARAAMDDGFARVGLAEIVSFTVPDNVRSRRVMERLGMTRSEADDFEHPRLPVGHRLRKHVLYRAGASSDPGARSSPARPAS